MDYVTIEALAKDAERDVEVNGRRYRVRRLLARDVLRIFGELMVSPEPGPEQGSEGKTTAERIEQRLRSLKPDERVELIGSSEQIIVEALIVPKITTEQLYLIPGEDRGALVDAVLSLTGLSRPLPSGAASAPVPGF